ncbi:MAG: methyltransferase domain-containing protein [Candidatus Cloacimonetes bacterium]|nr:methyltransferase domain-containing protein [Candidatus Cloacimonadota bacterium]
MKNVFAEMFNRKASDPKNKPDKIIEAISLKPGQNIADMGSGGGYFSLRFAKIVGEEGKVYAVDTNSHLLDFVKKSAKVKGLDNVIPITASGDSLDIPEKSLDFIFMRNVTHHLKNRTKYFEDLKKYLKSEGKIIVIEYSQGKLFSFQGIFGHYVLKEIIQQELKKAGYIFKKKFDFLPDQHFTIYSKS